MYRIYYYVQTNLICILVLMIVIFYFFKKGSANTASIIFKNLCISTILFCFFDMCAGILRGTMFPHAHFFIEISNALYLEFGTIISYLWLKYVYIQLEQNNSNYKKKIRFYAIPLIMITCLILFNHHRNIFFEIDSNNLYIRKKGIVFYFFVSCFYLCVPTLKIITTFLKSKQKFIDKKILNLVFFIIPPTITNIVQFWIYGLTLNQVGITFSILIVLLNHQKEQIKIDELTSLNNRFEFNRYLNEIMTTKKDDDKISLFMIDADHFKQINDKYGHLTGDKALVEIAKTIKKVSEKQKKKLFTSRYGGDEFIIVGVNLEENEIKSIQIKIREELNKINQKGHNPYVLKVSIGVNSTLKKEIKSVSSFIQEADHKMYQKKQKKKL